MKTTGIIFFFLFFMSGGFLSSSIYDISFMNFTICHAEDKITKDERSDMTVEEGEFNVKNYEHLEIHVVDVIPHLLHGDKLICRKNHEHSLLH